MHPAQYNQLRNESLAGTTSLAGRGKRNTVVAEDDPQDRPGLAGVTAPPRAPPLSMDSFIREPECRQVTGLSRVTRWRLERAGLFPKRRHLSFGTIGWLRSEIAHWVSTRQAA